MSASAPRMKATISNSGTRNRRNFALEVSTRTMRHASKSNFARKKTSPKPTVWTVQSELNPNGKKVLTSRVMSTSCLMEAPHSIKARYGPEYSRTIASWIMVNSRWVAGLSTGMHPVSAISTIKSAANASICDGARNLQLWDRGNRHFPAAAQTTERASGVESAQGKKEATKRQEIDHRENATEQAER